MALSDAKARNAKPRAKPYKISDGDGLFLMVAPSGSKYWRFRYHFGDKEKLLALGVYPEISLGDARARRTEARKAIALGEDPSAIKKEAKRQAILKASNSFEAIAREWFDHRKHEWVEKYSERLMSRLETYAFPKLGNLPIAEIKAPEVLAMLRVV